jgi:hypothetical protein
LITVMNDSVLIGAGDEVESGVAQSRNFAV